MTPEFILVVQTYALLGNLHSHSLWDNYPGLIFNVDCVSHFPGGGGRGERKGRTVDNLTVLPPDYNITPTPPIIEPRGPSSPSLPSRA